MVHVQFIKGGASWGFGYQPGDQGELLDLKQAQELESHGVLKIIEPPVELPDDLPGRDKLVENGFKTIHQLQAIDDYTEIPGIGKVLANKIAEYLK